MRTFVTGSTGFLGRHLMQRLLARGGEIVVLVRGARREERSGTLDALHALALERGAKLIELDGDVTEPGLGLATSDLAVLAPERLDHVFHLAAVYDLEADAEALRLANVEGTRNVLALLAKHGFAGVLHHVSSIAVAGDFEGTFTEPMLDAKQGHPTEYHRTKHESEALVRAEKRFAHRIYRPGAIVGHSRTGEMDRLDGPYYLFRAIHAARDAMPRWVTLPSWKVAPIPMVPVDFVADAIDAIAHRASVDGTTFHVVDHAPPSFRKTFNLIADAAGAPRMGRFRADRLADWLPGGRTVVGQLGSLKFLRRQYLEALGIPPVVAESHGREVRYDATNLLRALEGTGIACPPQAEYVEALWDHYLRRLDPRRDPEARDRKALAGKVVVITGASSGIGESLARYCGGLGAKLVLVARREDELARVTKELAEAGATASYVVADLTDLEACDRVVAVAIERHGAVDVLVNNAGRSIRRPITESLERFHDLERVMQINFFGPARLIRAALPGMRARGGGVIVNVLSAGTHMASPRFGAYTASKAALAQLGDTLAAEHLHEGIRVVSAFLPWVRTPMMDATGKFEETKAMSPERAARWIVEGIAEQKQHVISGDVRRRFVAARLRPEGLTRLLNVLHRIYADDPTQHPELELDRQILKRFVKGRLM